MCRVLAFVVALSIATTSVKAAHADGETTPADTTPAETKSAETKSAERKSAETKSADTTPPVDDATLARALDDYYGGERRSGYTIALLGGLAAGAGAFFVTRDDDFKQGLGWAFVGFGGVELLGGIAYALSVDTKVDHYRALLERDPRAFREEERVHIRGTINRFVIYRVTELVLLVGGASLAAYGFVAGKDAMKGAGIGIGGLAFPIVVVDTINDARAHAYLDALDRFTPRVSPGTSGRPWTFSLGTRF